MTSEGLLDTVATILDAWTLSDLIDPNNLPAAALDPSDDLANGQAWVAWTLGDEEVFEESRTAGGWRAYTGRVVFQIGVQMGSGDRQTQQIRAELESRFRTAAESYSGLTFTGDVTCSEELQDGDTWTLRELEIPYLRQEG